MDDLVERAVESIDHLDTLIERFDCDPALLNGPAEPSNGFKKIGPYGIPEEIIRQCEIAIAAILRVLSSNDRSVKPSVSGRPPEWWRDIRASATRQRLKDTSAKQALLDALAILDSHVSENSPHIAGLVLLIGDLDLKIKATRSRSGFRAPSEPYPNGLILFFDPEIDEDIDYPVKESVSKVVPPSETCVGFLRSTLEEIEALE